MPIPAGIASSGLRVRSQASAAFRNPYVKPNGAKLWRYDCRLRDSTAKTASFGAYPLVSLAAARKLHTAAGVTVSGSASKS
ncbi:MAG TPA: Arm DNA-binding domain-containing protein [Bradyrhizobium sp.]|jgi:hypothetical protein|uniref:Arm DNA-binding domain-containing protein n=1 Tax=Bradyrhizobium sp. TaxID=376 RepID=UPI002C9B2159|nr:Arm DNA-binding domain-containing protein [Bradyrhizobium sp.]HTA99360.1 Arm DNA-binding domain-containing protein [Bradyrhizobium sp.]